MKKFPILMMSSILALMFSITACGEKVSNNLGGATRGNNAYDYNYDYSGTGNNGDNALGFDGGNSANYPGYWDYYGITNGTANDSIRNGFINNHSTAPFYPNTAYNINTTPKGIGTTGGTGLTGNTNTAENTSTTLDSATVAN